jgi:hypothetical protein
MIVDRNSDQKSMTIINIIHWEESFCVRSVDSGVCVGDSGSSLFVEDDHKYYLTMRRLCSKKPTTLITDVSKYYQFIVEKQNKE